MAAVSTATKSKKPSIQIHTGVNGKTNIHPASPAAAGSVKRLPGALPPQSVGPANMSTSATVTRPGRRLQRISTKTNLLDTSTVDKKAAWPAEPFIITEKYIMNKYRGRPPSLIVHLYPNYFRFDQQEGNFSYHSEMRIFIEHLKKKTIPHDMLEELRIGEVRFYDGWLIVKVVDHRTGSGSTALVNNSTSSGGDEDKPFSIHNANPYITPSPYKPRPIKEADHDKSPGLAQDALRGADVASRALPRSQTNFYYTALRPTNMSRHIDLMLDFMAPDPKAKKVQKDPRTPGVPQTPLGTMPPTPSADKPPPAKKQKLRIDPKDYLEYEAKIVNGTAPPLYLEPVHDVEDVAAVHEMLADPECQEDPASPKSRKRTTAELAADDAYAKQQERFMLIMDARSSNSVNANTTGVDTQATTVPFQPRFEKFNALDAIRRDLAERKQRDKERQLQEDELRRQQQQRHNEEEKHRVQQAAINERKQQAIRVQQLNQQRQTQEALAMAQQQQVANAQRPGTASRPQPNGIPLQMQAQMMAPNSSPIIRQGTPNMASSPIANVGRPTMMNGPIAGAGSPRPASALQHAHPMTQNMIRQASGQGGPSRNGTPQIPHSTPGMPNATPILRQGTPAHLIPAQASPVGQMQVPTPQMNQAMLQAQMQNANRQALSQAQIQEIQRRQQLAMNAQVQAGQVNPAQMAELQARSQANLERQAAMAQARANMQGTPQQQQHMSPNGPAAQQAYKGQLAEQMKQRMASMAGGQLTSPAPQQQQMTQQQIQQMHLHRMQAAQAQAQAQVQGHVQQPQSAQPLSAQQQQQIYAKKFFDQLVLQRAQQYGGVQNIPPDVKQQLTSLAHARARQVLQTQAQTLRQNMAPNGLNGQTPQQMAMMQQMAAQQAATLAVNQGQSMNVGQQQMTPQMMQQLQQHQAQARAQQAQQAQQAQITNQTYQMQLAQMQQMQLQAQQQAAQGRQGG